jgi:hypothetical protein
VFTYYGISGYITPDDIERVLSATSESRKRSRKNSMKKAIPNLSGIMDHSKSSMWLLLYSANVVKYHYDFYDVHAFVVVM